MLGNFKKEDLRIVKTQKAFQSAMGALLERRKFKQITVNDLCEEALTSRAAFYTHYKDKYDLLQSWFFGAVNELKSTGIKNVIDSLIFRNSKTMQNILSEADDEAVGIVVKGLINALMEAQNLPAHKKQDPEYTLLTDFCSGGLFELIKRQDNPKHGELQASPNYFFELFKSILQFHIDYNSITSR